MFKTHFNRESLLCSALTMVKINKLLFIFIAFAVNQVSADQPKKLVLSVFYESKCPDSKHFIVNQLKPAMQLLHEYVELRFIPFGKARHIAGGLFECQHGETECRGNMVQDCALNSMRSRSDLEKVDYVICEMQTQAGTRENMQCVQRNNINTAEVTNCLLTSNGIALQLDAEYQTNQIQPKFIPSVTINEIFNQQDQDRSQVDLIGVLCSKMGNAGPC